MNINENGQPINCETETKCSAIILVNSSEYNISLNLSNNNDQAMVFNT